MALLNVNYGMDDRIHVINDEKRRPGPVVRPLLQIATKKKNRPCTVQEFIDGYGKKDWKTKLRNLEEDLWVIVAPYEVPNTDDIPSEVLDYAEAQRLIKKAPFKGWKVLRFGGEYQLKAPNDLPLFLRKFKDDKGPFYHAYLNIFNADEKPETALKELQSFLAKLSTQQWR